MVDGIGAAGVRCALLDSPPTHLVEHVLQPHEVHLARAVGSSSLRCLRTCGGELQAGVTLVAEPRNATRMQCTPLARCKPKFLGESPVQAPSERGGCDDSAESEA